MHSCMRAWRFFFFFFSATTVEYFKIRSIYIYIFQFVRREMFSSNTLSFHFTMRKGFVIMRTLIHEFEVKAFNNYHI